MKGLDAVIAWGGILEESALELPSLHLPCAASGDLSFPSAEIQFGQSAEVPKAFRAHRFYQEDVRQGAPPGLREGDVIMARLGDKPLWVRRANGVLRHDVSAMPLPEVKSEGCLYRYFHSGNFIAMLPLIDFLRQLTGEEQWLSSGPRACFQFDDPNLHAGRYGWLDFRRLAASARSSPYHVAFATVPLDAWLVRRRTAEVFSHNSGQLSLMMHGNDHLHSELASFGSQEKAIASLVQALQRIGRAEKAGRLEICRVMAPPHGVCGEEVLEALARLGFDAVSTAVPCLLETNANKPWSHGLGLRVSDVVAGLPVLPRFRFKSKQYDAAIHLAAYLHRPIIPYGHHEDVAEGLGILEEVAASINALGNAQWMRMSAISRHNYQTQKQGGLFRVRAYSRLLHVAVPPECHSISVLRPHSTNGRNEGMRLGVPGGEMKFIESYAGESLPVEPGSSVEIAFIHPEAIAQNLVKIPHLNVWAFARRLLCEGRDRFAPLAGRFGKRPQHEAI